MASSRAAVANALYASLWHSFFYGGGGGSGGGGGGGALPVLHLLDAVGFTKAGDVALAVEAERNCIAQARDDLAAAGADSDPKALDWPRRFFLTCATAALSGDGVDSNAKPLTAVLRQQRQPERQRDASSLFSVLASTVAATAGSADGSASMDGFPSLFSLFDAAKSRVTAGGSADEGARVFAEAQLYAALCLHCHFPTVKQLAKLLTVYIYQEDAFVAQAVLHTAAGGDGKYRRHRDEARARGVVAGLLGYALDTAQRAQRRLREALQSMQEEGERASEPHGGHHRKDSRPLLPPVGPRPEQTSAVLSAAAHTLVQLLTQESQLKAAEGTSGALGSLSMGREIVHTVQELVFTAVLGAGTALMSNRPTQSPQQQAQQGDGLRSFTVTHRALTIHEVDALTRHLFPLLLQQLGYEWPWSELLRHCRGLDKLQVSPPFPYVALSSNLLVETVLLRLSSHTYPERLENLLPESFDRVREKLGLLPAPNRSAAEEDGREAPAREGRDRARLFFLPEYYQEPVTALQAYYSRTKLGRLRVEEAERVLSVAVSTLPMVVQLRALAPPEEPEDGDEEGGTGRARDHRLYPLTGARVTALVTRFKAECLLASVIVHTQLETHSQVQGMMRELAPLFLKLTVALGGNPNALAVPLLTSAGGDGPQAEGDASGSSHGSLGFTDEAKRLINDIGYQFPSIEWLPWFAHAFHARHHRAAQPSSSQTGMGALPSSSSFPLFGPAAAGAAAGGAAVSLPYSVYAAVAHQMRASFHSPLGSSSSSSPSGFRSSLVTAPSRKCWLSEYLGKEVEESGGGVGELMNPLKRATRILETLMLPCWLDARVSSCDLEGTIAVTATRVVGGNRHGSVGGAAGGGGGGAAGGGGDSLLARLSHLLKPHILELFWRDSQADDDGGYTGKDEEAVRALTNALLRQGASSFELTMEAKDFVLTTAQCFLPLTGDLSRKVEGTARGGAVKPTAELLRGALAWCQSTVGNNAVRAEVRMRLQQHMQGSQPPSFDSVLPAVYNSCTFDACALARRVLLSEVPARLLEKMRLRRQQSADLIARRDRCIRRIQGHDADADDNGGERGEEAVPLRKEVDRLLLHQFSQWVSLLRAFALWSEEGEEGDGGIRGAAVTGGELPELSAAQWLWYSPYAAN